MSYNNPTRPPGLGSFSMGDDEFSDLALEGGVAPPAEKGRSDLLTDAPAYEASAKGEGAARSRPEPGGGTFSYDDEPGIALSSPEGVADAGGGNAPAHGLAMPDASRFVHVMPGMAGAPAPQDFMPGLGRAPDVRPSGEPEDAGEPGLGLAIETEDFVPAVPSSPPAPEPADDVAAAAAALSLAVEDAPPDLTASAPAAPPVPISIDSPAAAPPGREPPESGQAEGGQGDSGQGDSGPAEGEKGGAGRIGERLVRLGIITDDQLNVALQEKKMTGALLGEVLVDLGFINDQTLSAFLAESSGFEVFDPKNTLFDAEALELIDKATAMKYQVLPVAIKDNALILAMSDPYDVVAMDTMRRYLPKNLVLKPVVSTPSVLSQAIDTAYGYASSIPAILRELEEGSKQEDVASLSATEAFAHPVVRLVNALVFDAVKIGASDLHFEPEENFVRLRYRKDGVLFTAQILHKKHWSPISQRLKIISGMNIADKLAPQDGRFGMNVGGRMADFRVSSLPTVHGENIVLRVLDQSASIMPMSGLGFSPENNAKIKKAQSRPEGIIIVTGPTGSGKTTSLYSMLNEINNVEVNIQTLEDPVEYSLPMIRQTHVREGVLEFADGIKALLRQDPDIIFIGEIRDAETAQMALKAAMTGHQVYTTLHTNDSFGAIPRILDLGLKAGMVAGAIVAVFAQRLVRRVCQQCREPHVATEEECGLMGVDAASPPTIYTARQGGCKACGGQGYKGRTAVVEILLFDEELDEMLAAGKTKVEMKAVAVRKGFKSMKDDGILKILDGQTTFEALARVVDIHK